MNAYVRLMLSLARKFVYDIKSKASICSHHVEVNVSAYHSCAYSRTKDRLPVKTKVKLIIIGEVLKWGYSEARVQHQIKSFSKANDIIFKNKQNRFQKQITAFSKTNKNISKKNSKKQNHFQKQIKTFLKRTQTNKIISKNK